MLLQTTIRTLDSVTIVDCRGWIVTGEETAALSHLAKDLMHESARIILNLEGVTHIDSNAIGMLFGLYVSAEKKGITIKLAGLGGDVKSQSDNTKLTRIYSTFPTVVDAVASFEPVSATREAA